MPDWRDEIVTVMTSWIDAEGGSNGVARWRPIGPLRAEAGRGWYALDVRGSRIEADQLGALRIATDGDRPEQGQPVLELVQDGQLIRVKVADFAEFAAPCLWQLKQPATYLLTALRDGVAAIGESGLGHQLARGQLATAPRPVVGRRKFTPAQWEAYDSCFAPGVRLVWGPPGTGKTRVLTEAIDQLITAGRRVLLVSSTNIAVDNALLGVVRQRERPAGTMVRVGPPHLPAIAADPRVSMIALVRESLGEVEQERLALQERLVALRDAVAEVEVLELKLAGFDSARYARIQGAISHADTIPRLAEQASADRARITGHERAAAEARRNLEHARSAYADTQAARAAYAEAELLRTEADRIVAATDELTVQVLMARQKLAAANAELARYDEAPMLRRIARRNRGSLLAAVQASQQQVDELQRHEIEVKTAARRREAALRARAKDLIAGADVTPAEIATRHRAIPAAEQEHVAAVASVEQATATSERSQTALVAAEAVTRPSPDDLAYVADADRHGRPALAPRLSVLRREVARDAGARNDLERRHTAVVERFDKLRRDAEGEVIRQAKLVATTLARFRATPALAGGTYDVVLVDEVAAATVPEVILAVSRASRTALLLGDFMQLGAVIGNAAMERSERPDIVRWLHRDVFAHCGIESAADAQAHTGCTSLDIQHRFGLDVMAVANAIAYDDLLRAADHVRPRPPDDPEIVLVDVDDLGDLARIRPTSTRAGWWPAGALLGRVLAEYHLARGELVGIVTPYRHQVEATLEALRDREDTGTSSVEVGTAHRFQGREFPVVVFDLVEDQWDKRWLALADLAKGSWERDGVRLFNVAVTRTQSRIYLIGSRRRVLDAVPGSPLGAVGALLRERRGRTVSASQLITPLSTPADQQPLLGPFGRELTDLLAQHVQVADIHDELGFYQVFEEQIRSARHTIWIWAAWTARRVIQLLPLLADARDRGVTVRVFVRDDSDKLQRRADFQAHLAMLRDAVTSVVAVNMMHQKIVVVDEQVVLLGSLNVLSQSWTREVMLVMNGHRFARKLLEHERAEEFARPPRCGACGGDDIDLRKRQAGKWYWRCAATTCPGRRGDRAWVSEIGPSKASSTGRQRTPGTATSS